MPHPHFTPAHEDNPAFDFALPPTDIDAERLLASLGAGLRFV
jgi:hypothetical protein